MALVILLLLTIIGVAAMNTSTLQEKMAGNARDKNLSFQAAETALRTGEDLIGGSVNINSVVAVSTITNDGLHKPAVPPTAPVWISIDWISGSDLKPLSGLGGVYSQPKYIIEDLGEIPDTSGSLGMPETYKSKGKNLFRITARGVGGTEFATSMVQSTYEKRF
jgi:type IV pilus assembly protein PilX